jgi:hypothetical protein
MTTIVKFSKRPTDTMHAPEELFWEIVMLRHECKAAGVTHMRGSFIVPADREKEVILGQELLYVKQIAVASFTMCSYTDGRVTVHVSLYDKEGDSKHGNQYCIYDRDSWNEIGLATLMSLPTFGEIDEKFEGIINSNSNKDDGIWDDSDKC